MGLGMSRFSDLSRIPSRHMGRGSKPNSTALSRMQHEAPIVEITHTAGGRTTPCLSGRLALMVSGGGGSKPRHSPTLYAMRLEIDLGISLL